MLHLLFISPISHRCAVLHKAPGGWANWIIDRDDPLCWQTSGSRFNTIAGIGPCYHSKMDSPLGFVEDANVCHSFPVGLFCFPPLLFGGVVVNSVGCQTTPGGLGQPFCGPWSRCGLETMDVLGSDDATLQLLKQRTELSKNTITLFLTSIRKKTNIRTCWGPRNALGFRCKTYLRLFFVVIAQTYLKKKKKKAYLKQFFAVDTAVVLQTLSPGKNPPDLWEEEFYCSR